MDAETFVVDLAPYAVTAIGIVVAGVWGNSALKAKNEVLKVKDEVVAAKDEQLKAIAAGKDEQILTVKTALAETIRVKDTHIQMLEQFRPTNLLEQLRAFITWNEELSTQLTRSRSEVQASVAAAKEGSKELETMKRDVGRLSDELERAESARKVAEELADSLRRLPSGGGALTVLGASWPYLSTLRLGSGIGTESGSLKVGPPNELDLDKLGLTGTISPFLTHGSTRLDVTPGGLEAESAGVEPSPQESKKVARKRRKAPEAEGADEVG